MTRSDLAVADADGRVAGYELFWFDHTTLGFDTDAARNLYLGAGFVQTSRKNRL